MMNVQEYIESGVLNDYCLGLLDAIQQQQVEADCRQYPELRKEIEHIKHTLDEYAFSQSVAPAGHLKERIWNTLSNLNAEENTRADQWPVLTKFADKDAWLRLVKPLLPDSLEQELFIKVFREDDQLMQSVLWTRVNYPDEVHDDLQECFMILEGECECYVGDEVIRLGPGDYFDVPMHVHHDVKVISAEVLAVVQRKKIA